MEHAAADSKRHIDLSRFHAFLLQGRAQLADRDDVHALPMFVTFSSGRCTKRLVTLDVVTSSCFEALAGGTFKESSGDIQLFQEGTHVPPEVKPSAMELWAQCYEQNSIELTPSEFIDLLWFADCYQCTQLVAELTRQPIVTADNFWDIVKAYAHLPHIRQHCGDDFVVACRSVFLDGLAASTISEPQILDFCAQHVSAVGLLQRCFDDSHPYRFQELKRGMVNLVLRHGTPSSSTSMITKALTASTAADSTQQQQHTEPAAQCAESQGVLRKLSLSMCKACEDDAVLQSLDEEGGGGVCSECARVLLSTLLKHRAAAKDPVAVHQRMFSMLESILPEQLEKLNTNSTKRAPYWTPEKAFKATLMDAITAGTIDLAGMAETILTLQPPPDIFVERVWRDKIHEMMVQNVHDFTPVFDGQDMAVDDNNEESEEAVRSWIRPTVTDGRLVVRQGQRVLVCGDSEGIKHVVVEDGGEAVFLTMNLHSVIIAGAESRVLAIGCNLTPDDTERTVVALEDHASATLIACTFTPAPYFHMLHAEDGCLVACLECNFYLGACGCSGFLSKMLFVNCVFNLKSNMGDVMSAADSRLAAVACLFHNGVRGVFASQGGKAWIYDCTVTDNDFGVEATQNGHVYCFRTTFERNQHNYFMDSDGIVSVR